MTGTEDSLEDESNSEESGVMWGTRSTDVPPYILGANDSERALLSHTHSESVRNSLVPPPSDTDNSFVNAHSYTRMHRPEHDQG